MSQRLYKYKAGTERDIDNLLNDKLFVSSLNKMNDPLELGFYVEKEKNLSCIVEFQKALLESYSCLSFSTSVSVRRLWNYYTEGMKGLVIEYRDYTIKKKLITDRIECINIDYIEKVNPKYTYEKLAYEGKVLYDGEKTDLTMLYDQYCMQHSGIQFLSGEFLFHKDDSWEDEKEYRFAFPSEYLSNDCISGIIPTAVYVGYKMEGNCLKKVKDYCISRKIPVYCYMPNFKSKSSKKFIKTTIFDPKTTAIETLGAADDITLT